MPYYLYFYLSLWPYPLNHPLATVEPVSAVEPQLEYVHWATVGSRFGSTGSVISAYVCSGVNRSLLCKEIFVNNLFVLYILQFGLLNELLLLW